MLTKNYLSKFYEETCLRVGYNDGLPTNCSTSFQDELYKLSDCVKGVSLSGWNPPPGCRRVQGDLFYVEVVTAAEGAFHVTATFGGFFVSKMTRSNFDPSPAARSNFSHELHLTILGQSSSYRQSWTHFVATQASQNYAEIDDDCTAVIQKQSNEEEENNADVQNSRYALSSIAGQYLTGRWRTDSWQNANLQWASAVHSPVEVPQKGNTTTSLANGNHGGAHSSTTNGPIGSGHGSCLESLVKHTFDMARVQDDLLESFGTDVTSAPREWNEEVQTVRAMACPDQQATLMKCKYLQKVTTEFIDASRLGAIAIVDGHINPMNAEDSEECHIYFFNNIFFSRAMDAKDTFRLCDGYEASRKYAGHDLKNQRFVQSLGIDGLYSGLIVLIDYRGSRLLAQTVVPGILNPCGQFSARLLYGSLDQGSRICCKEKALQIMQTVGSKLHIAERNIFQIPLSTSNVRQHTLNEGNEGDVAVSAAAAVSAECTNAQDKAVVPVGAEPEPMHIRIDEVDEVPPTLYTNDSGISSVQDDPKYTIPHIGPLEGKIIQGADGRFYFLEMMRLTPRDANFVDGEKGTGLISQETLDNIDCSLKQAYLLRQEIFVQYMQRLLVERRKEILMKAMGEKKEKQEKEKQTAATAAVPSNPASNATEVIQEKSGKSGGIDNVGGSVDSVGVSVEAVGAGKEKDIEEEDESTEKIGTIVNNEGQNSEIDEDLNDFITPEITEKLKQASDETIGIN